MDTAMDVDLVQSNKLCRTCRVNIIPGHLHFKNCDLCREKNRSKEARRVERRREEYKYINVHKEMFMESISMEDDNGSRSPTRENPIPSGSKSSTSPLAGTLKLNAQPRFLYELEGKEKNRAVKEMKASLQKKIQDNGGIKSMVGQVTRNRVSENAREFQTASTLYEKLKRKALRSSTAGKRLSFHGYHCIVAVLAINHEDRIAMVAKDLRRIARISFALRSTSIEKTIDDSMCSMVYDCNCLSSATGNMTGSSNQAPAGRGMECRGTVRVTAELDVSHPHGLVGQKIIIHIHH